MYINYYIFNWNENNIYALYQYIDFHVSHYYYVFDIVINKDQMK